MNVETLTVQHSTDGLTWHDVIVRAGSWVALMLSREATCHDGTGHWYRRVPE
jgi:hypothetical protein